ncbi:diaminopimelate decarboxylase [Murinocardiopsis flavida]|uniref:Diaminopimelate decarboxylase n=1 Tax=Murinocardiopsis flavida TaxID=645275 RepID=A0A2P8C9F7_9ACTN|nr:diaminopimelate decarboxylase [Murinocardiopsis flavida]PSK81598.1 diaminopimelate decarboxylase [Murinocardiopsis flavida]
MMHLAGPLIPQPDDAEPKEPTEPAEPSKAAETAIDAPPPWPDRTVWTSDGDLQIDGASTAAAAHTYGTPLILVSERHVRDRCRAYRAAFPGTEVAYAAKAFLCTAMARWVHEEGLSLDLCSGGELAVATAVGFPAERLLLHGNAKPPRELAAARSAGVDRVVIDSMCEVNRLAVLAKRRSPQRVLLRITPGIRARTHKAIATGGEDQKFGLSIATGEAAAVAERILHRPELTLAGVHCHIGSQIATTGPFLAAARRAVAFLSELRDRFGVTLGELDLGGGHAVATVRGGTALDPALLGARLLTTVRAECADRDLPMPRLTVEPGRAIVGNAGVTVYRVLAVKSRPGRGRFIAVDGGMSDNPRPALYGARHEIALVGRTTKAPPRPATVVGRHCEAGDVLAHRADLPDDVHPGDLLAVACTGAYTHAMASTYNMVGRPPIAAIASGRARLLVRRETEADLLARDMAHDKDRDMTGDMPSDMPRDVDQR